MTNIIDIEIKRLPHASDLNLPDYATYGSAGLDLPAAIETSIDLLPGQRKLIPTGFCIALPEGYEAQIRSRSGLALKHGITVLNSPGTIDSDYRGELQVVLINHGEETFTIDRGMRIAQLVVQRYTKANLQEIEEFDNVTLRDVGGWGSTGLKACA